MGVVRFIASRLSGSGKNEGGLSRTSNTIAWVSVCLSLVVMIIAISVVAGFKSEIRSKVTGFMGSVILVQPGQQPVNEQYPFSEQLSYNDKILSLSGVESISGVTYRSGVIKTESEIEGLCFKGVDSLYDFSFFASSLSGGDLLSLNGRISNDLMISGKTSSRLGLEVGDQVPVYFIGDDVKVRKLKVCGIFDAGLEDIDSHFALIDKRQIQRINGWSADEVSSVEIRTRQDASIESVAQLVEEIEFTESSGDDTPLFVKSVKSVFGNLFDWLALLDMNVLMILALMILVAGFNMISAVLIILFEKISMIGLLKSLGMTTKEVGHVFLLRSLSIVGKGMVWGNVIGIAACLVQKFTKIMKLDPASYFVSFVPVKLDFGQILTIDIISLAAIMSIISLSSLFISKVSPDRTMRVD